LNCFGCEKKNQVALRNENWVLGVVRDEIREVNFLK